jgi:hypothetical protein
MAERCRIRYLIADEFALQSLLHLKLNSLGDFLDKHKSLPSFFCSGGFNRQ